MGRATPHERLQRTPTEPMNSSAAASDVVVPRNFRLLEEYDCAIGKEEKSFLIAPHAGYINYGADDTKDDILLHYWEGIVIGPQGSHIGECIYSLSIFVPDNYPAAPRRSGSRGRRSICLV